MRGKEKRGRDQPHRLGRQRRLKHRGDRLFCLQKRRRMIIAWSRGEKASSSTFRRRRSGHLPLKEKERALILEKIRRLPGSGIMEAFKKPSIAQKGKGGGGESWRIHVRKGGRCQAFALTAWSNTDPPVLLIAGKVQASDCRGCGRPQPK